MTFDNLKLMLRKILMNDFSIDKYVEFLNVLKSHYVCMGFADYLKIDSKNIIDERKVSILRHDVDLLPENSLSFAKNTS